jgi:nitronate monooxygenase
VIIQGGMGIGISNWQLARSVSLTGSLGVVSGTAISRIFVSRLMNGDSGGDMRRALSFFPFPDAKKEILDRYFIHEGRTKSEPYRSQPVHTINPSGFLNRLTVAANFTEVFLAKEGHDAAIGINLLEKIQLANLPSIYGAMLAGVDYVFMGAGIPVQIPAILDKLAEHEPVSYRLDVKGAKAEDDFRVHFDPQAVFPGIKEISGSLKRPKFIPIISSVVLADALLKRSDGIINGFVIEGHSAGGHNAPPRGVIKLSALMEPIYGTKDVVDLEKIRHLGIPFWLAGGYGHPEKLQAALAEGAAGIQAGTVFSLCRESGMAEELKEKILGLIASGSISVFTSHTASPTGFPFKVVNIAGSVSDSGVYDERKRICDLGLLRNMYVDQSGTVCYRCASEPVVDYLRKGGKIEDTEGRTCLCNSLSATAGFAQIRCEGYLEPQIVTSGDGLESVIRIMHEGRTSYSAADVVKYLRGEK